MLHYSLLLLITAFGDGSEITAEHLVAKHLKATGSSAWTKINSMKVTGDYESFSNTAPFVLYRKRPQKYRFDHFMIEWDVTRAFDGENAWWQGAMFRAPTGAPIPEPQNKVTIWESVFESPLLGYAEKGHKVELAGNEDFEGANHYLLKMTHANGLEETFYINPKTWLISFKISQTYEYGNPSTLEVFYDDYRKVGGVSMPFYVEQEWHTRHRVFTISDIAVNVDLDDKMFQMPEQPKEEAPEEPKPGN